MKWSPSIKKTGKRSISRVCPGKNWLSGQIKVWSYSDRISGICPSSPYIYTIWNPVLLTWPKDGWNSPHLIFCAHPEGWIWCFSNNHFYALPYKIFRSISPLNSSCRLLWFSLFCKLSAMFETLELTSWPLEVLRKW